MSGCTAKYVKGCETVFYLTGKTRSRKKNGLRRSGCQLPVPGGDDQVFASGAAHYTDEAGKDTGILFLRHTRCFSHFIHTLD